MADISLTASMRSNLLSLQNTQDLMDMTQERLSTGKKVNSAIDNPSSYYTAQSLTNRRFRQFRLPMKVLRRLPTLPTRPKRLPIPPATVRKLNPLKTI